MYLHSQQVTLTLAVNVGHSRTNAHIHIHTDTILPSRTENVVQKEELQNISDKLGIRKQFSSRSVYVLTFLGENSYLSFNRSSTNLT